MPQSIDIVWLLEERTYAVLVNLGAYYSTVKYIRDGEEVVEEIGNEDFEFWQERAIGYEQD